MPKQSLYTYSLRVNELYSKLKDKKSKQIFWERLIFEAEPSLDNLIGLIKTAEILERKEIERIKNWRDIFIKSKEEGANIVIYGAETFGRLYAKYFINSGMDFDCFIDQKYAGGELYGKKYVYWRICHIRIIAFL